MKTSIAQITKLFFELQVDEDFLKLKSSSLSMFVQNWQSVEKEIAKIGKSELQTNKFVSLVLNDIEKHVENFGEFPSNNFNLNYFNFLYYE